MFARHDVDRARRWPLLWVLGPLVVGAVVITGVTLALRASQGFPDIDLAEEIRLAALAGEPQLSDATEFAWDRVCVFPPYLPREAIDERLGFEWGRTDGHSTDGYLLLVFVRDRDAIVHAFVERGILEEPEAGGDCREPGDPRTQLQVPSGT